MCAGGVTFVQQFFFIKVMRQVGISLESQASLFLERGDLFGVINVVFFIKVPITRRRLIIWREMK